MCSVTSNSFWAMLLAETLIWMLMDGCCCCCCREDGAFGFSNDRSLVYCASTLSWGWAASWGAPLPLVMEISPGAGGGGGRKDRVQATIRAVRFAKMPGSARVAIIGLRRC